jgi:hypothetical protein
MTILIVFCGNIVPQLEQHSVLNRKRVLRQNWDFDLESKDNVVFTLSEPEKDVFCFNFILRIRVFSAQLLTARVSL